MEASKSSSGNLMSTISRSVDFSKGGGVIIAFVLLCLVLTIASPRFLTAENLLIVARQTVFVMIIGFAMTFVIAMGGIDLSVGATLALCGAVTARLLLDGANVWLAMLAALVLGTLVGAVNGFLIAKLGMTDFIATLGVMSILRGIIMLFTHGVPFFGLQIPTFAWFAQGYIGPVPVPVIITAILFFVCWFIMAKTRLGRFVLAIGSNQDAARLVGIQIPQVKIIIYAFCGLMAAISGLLLTSRLEAAMPEAGTGYELDVIAATVIGGTSLSGGRGNLFGTVIGAMVMGVVRNGLNLLSINVFWHQVVIGSIILIAVGIDRLSQQRLTR
jgi:ribose transport system permease protein